MNNPICGECLLVNICEEICQRAINKFKKFIGGVNKGKESPIYKCPGCGRGVKRVSRLYKPVWETKKLNAEIFSCDNCEYILKYCKESNPPVLEAVFRSEQYYPLIKIQSYRKSKIIGIPGRKDE